MLFGISKATIFNTLDLMVEEGLVMKQDFVRGNWLHANRLSLCSWRGASRG